MFLTIEQSPIRGRNYVRIHLDCVFELQGQYFNNFASSVKKMYRTFKTWIVSTLVQHFSLFVQLHVYARLSLFKCISSHSKENRSPSQLSFLKIRVSIRT